jgi:hypothetical protein
VQTLSCHCPVSKSHIVKISNTFFIIFILFKGFLQHVQMLVLMS